MIRAGIKKEEYREIKPYWIKRIRGKRFDAVRFRNGYAKNAPEFTIQLLSVQQSFGVIEWGAPPKKEVYILTLGEIL